ncbi:MAG: hypothetical protein Q8R83_10875 [Legionellaceae bacterium]|nr:hypothetical protein [Legionellaceae bacterium]
MPPKKHRNSHQTPPTTPKSKTNGTPGPEGSTPAIQMSDLPSHPSLSSLRQPIPESWEDNLNVDELHTQAPSPETIVTSAVADAEGEASDVVEERQIIAEALNTEMESTIVAETLNAEKEPTVVAETLNNEMESTIVAETLNTEMEPTDVAETLHAEMESTVVAETLNTEMESTVVAETLNNEMESTIVAETLNTEMESTVVAETLNTEMESTVVAETLNAEIESTDVTETLNTEMESTVVAETLNPEIEHRKNSRIPNLEKLVAYYGLEDDSVPLRALNLNNTWEPDYRAVRRSTRISPDQSSHNATFLLNLHNNKIFHNWKVQLAVNWKVQLAVAVLVIAAVLVIVALTANMNALPAIAAIVAGLSTLAANAIFGVAVGVAAVGTAVLVVPPIYGRFFGGGNSDTDSSTHSYSNSVDSDEDEDQVRRSIFTEATHFNS